MSENKKPRLAEILGVEVGQEFAIEGDRYTMRINAHGVRETLIPSGTEWIPTRNEDLLTRLINNPELIRPVVQWTQDDIEAAKAVRRLFPEHEWVARDKDGAIWVYIGKPDRDTDQAEFECLENMYGIPNTTLPSVTWENSPVRIGDILGAGE